jgi:non-homologous end joining protein Ku
MMEQRDQGLLATTLHYKYDVRDATPYFESIPDLKRHKVAVARKSSAKRRVGRAS